MILNIHRGFLLVRDCLKVQVSILLHENLRMALSVQTLQTLAILTE